jgi:hypothetical protein
MRVYSQLLMTLRIKIELIIRLYLLGRVCKSVYGQRGYVQVELVMRLRPKVKRLLPKIAEAIISIEIDSLEKR